MDKGIEALIAKVKKQTESFDTVVLKEDEAKALIAALERAQQEKSLLEYRLKNVQHAHLAADDRALKAERRIAELESAPNAMMQLSNELAEMKLPEDFPDDAELLIEIEFLDDVSVDIKTAQWLKELRRRRAAGGIVSEVIG